MAAKSAATSPAKPTEAVKQITYLATALKAPRITEAAARLADQAVAAAMIDRIVHHADVLTLKGASYPLRGRGIDSLPSIRTTTGETES